MEEVQMEIQEQIDKALANEDWRRARSLLKKALAKNPKSHWLLTVLSEAYYEERDYKNALKYSEKAKAVCPNCPLVLWDYAGALDMLDREKEAIEVWKGLVRSGARISSFDDCWESKRWAKSLLNDCRYRIALSYADLNEYAKARQYLRKHIAKRSPGIPSLYSKSDVNDKLQAIEAAESHQQIVDI